MKKIVTVAALAVSLLASAVVSSSATTTKSVMYECTKCHMKVSAATAKKDHYVDSMDGGKLVIVKTVITNKATAKKS